MLFSFHVKAARKKINEDVNKIKKMFGPKRSSEGHSQPIINFGNLVPSFRLSQTDYY